MRLTPLVMIANFDPLLACVGMRACHHITLLPRKQVVIRVHAHSFIKPGHALLITGPDAST